MQLVLPLPCTPVVLQLDSVTNGGVLDADVISAGLLDTDVENSDAKTPLCSRRSGNGLLASYLAFSIAISYNSRGP